MCAKVTTPVRISRCDQKCHIRRYIVRGLFFWLMGTIRVDTAKQTREEQGLCDNGRDATDACLTILSAARIRELIADQHLRLDYMGDHATVATNAAAIRLGEAASRGQRSTQAGGWRAVAEHEIRGMHQRKHGTIATECNRISNNWTRPGGPQPRSRSARRALRAIPSIHADRARPPSPPEYPSTSAACSSSRWRTCTRPSRCGGNA